MSPCRNFLSLLAAVRVFFRSRSDTAFEVLALRQQVALLKRRRLRPTLNSRDRLFLGDSPLCRVSLGRCPHGGEARDCHRMAPAGFRLYSGWRSRPRGGRPKITEEIRALIRRLATENPSWGAPKIHAELQKLGFLSERTVARYLRRIRRRGEPANTWRAFLQNHREVLVAFDFFTVPTITFRLLYCFFVIEHSRRRILHFNLTCHPHAEWSSSNCGKPFPRLAAIDTPSSTTIRSLT